jgi:hypothetical protein
MLKNKTGKVRIIVMRSRNYYCHRKAMNIICSAHVFLALFTQHAMRMSRVILSSVACLGRPYYSTYLINGTIFGKKFIEHKMCFDFLYNFQLKHLSCSELSEILS